MNPLEDSDAIFEYHRYMADRHGASSSLALGWRVIGDQQIRFEALAAMANLDGKTILDAGCGYGDLFAFLTERYTLVHYYGVEQIPEMLDEAARRYANFTNTTFISRNFLGGNLPMADYVFACGSLNYCSNDPCFIFKAISFLFDHCKEGLGFNLLRSVSTKGLLVAYDPVVILAHCATLTPHVKIVDDYADEDYTIWMYRE